MPERFFDIIAPLYDYIIRGNPPGELLELLELSGKEVVCEIGAGTGKQAQAVINSCGSLWLLEPSVHMLRLARKNVPEARAVFGFAENLPFNDGFFDRVFAVDSIHHWNDQLQGLREIRRVLRQNGLLVAIDFEPNSRFGHFIRSMENALRMGSKFYTIMEMVDLHRRAGLQVRMKTYLGTHTYAIVSSP